MPPNPRIWTPPAVGARGLGCRCCCPVQITDDAGVDCVCIFGPSVGLIALATMVGRAQGANRLSRPQGPCELSAHPHAGPTGRDRDDPSAARDAPRFLWLAPLEVPPIPPRAPADAGDLVGQGHGGDVVALAH